MNKKLLIAIPLILFCGLFIADKWMLLPWAKENFISWKKIEPPLYQSRHDLWKLYRNQYQANRDQKKRIGVIFGSSRSAEFDTDAIANVIPDSRTYNFSAPFACPSFLYYWLFKMEQENKLPDFAIIETDGLLFNERAIDYSLTYSYDSKFVFAHTEFNRIATHSPWDSPARFTFDEAETYFLKRAFAMYRYPPDFGALKENNETMPLILPGHGIEFFKGNEFRARLLKYMGLLNELKLGGIPNPMKIQLSPEKIDEDAAAMAAVHLKGFTFSRTQAGFFNQMLQTLAAKKIPTVLYWPVVSVPFQKKMDECAKESPTGVCTSGATAITRDTILARMKVADTEGKYLYLVDPASELRCQVFVDSLHLSGGCFPELEKILIRPILKNLK